MNKDHFSDTPQTGSSNNNQINWSLLSLRALKEAYHGSDHLCDDLATTLIARDDSIMCFVESDRMWPPIASVKAMFGPPVYEVLSRLPGDVFDRVDDGLFIVVEVPEVQMLAMNVPGPCSAPTDRGADTIVFFHPCWKLSQNALVGLIAHEIAHSFVNGKDYQSDETLANRQAKDWGFAEELLLLQKEKQEKLCARVSENPAPPDPTS